jgi:hypothetical protein
MTMLAITSNLESRLLSSPLRVGPGLGIRRQVSSVESRKTAKHDGVILEMVLTASLLANECIKMSPDFPMPVIILILHAALNTRVG